MAKRKQKAVTPKKRKTATAQVKVSIPRAGEFLVGVEVDPMSVNDVNDTNAIRWRVDDLVADKLRFKIMNLSQLKKQLAKLLNES